MTRNWKDIIKSDLQKIPLALAIVGVATLIASPSIFLFVYVFVLGSTSLDLVSRLVPYLISQGLTIYAVTIWFRTGNEERSEEE